MRLPAILCAVAAAAWVGSTAAASGLSVELDAEVRGELFAKMLEEELPGALNRPGTDRVLKVRLGSRAERFRLVVEDGRGRLLLEREVPRDDGDEAALRALVLLVRSSADAASASFAPDTAPQPAPAGAPLAPDAAPQPAPVTEPLRRVVITAAVAATGWSRPAQPLPGPGLLVAYAPKGDGRLSLGARLAFPGLLGADRSTAAIDAQGREHLLLAEARLRLIRFGPARLEALAGAGAGWVVITAAPALFAGEVEALRSAFVQGLGVAAGALHVGLGAGVHLRLEAGLLLRAGRGRVRLPEAWREQDAPVDTGWAVPWLAAGAGVSF